MKRKRGRSAAQFKAKQNDLLSASRTVGRPKIKQSQRKKPVLIRQISDSTKERMQKAAAILKRGN